MTEDLSSTPSSSFWRDRRVLVTGATGFLGAHLTGLLVDEGADVVTLVRDVTPLTPVTSYWSERTSVVTGDVRDQKLLERVLGEYEISTVMHLAAQTQVQIANRNPISTFDSNIGGTWALLEAVRRSPDVQQVVTASSDKAYGSQPRLPYTEDMPLLLLTPGPDAITLRLPLGRGLVGAVLQYQALGTCLRLGEKSDIHSSQNAPWIPLFTRADSPHTGQKPRQR